MATLVADCPRCGVNKMTFDVNSSPVYRGEVNSWQDTWELCCACRDCHLPSIFKIRQVRTDIPNNGSVFSGDWVVTAWYAVDGYVSTTDFYAQEPPDHVPDAVADAFEEAATCMAAQCWNAAGAMFRTAIDLATQEKLPKEGGGESPGRGVRRVLARRLAWLFDKGILPRELEPLSTCIREDGNDSVHAALIGKEEAEDLLDFTVALLERVYTEPRRLELAKERREKRRTPQVEE